MKRTDLKPCPFCGREAVLMDAFHDYYVRCRHGCVEQSNIYRAPGTAIKNWNKRADPFSVLTDKVEGVKKAIAKPVIQEAIRDHLQIYEQFREED